MQFTAFRPEHSPPKSPHSRFVDIGGMTNQLTYTDLDAPKTPAAPPRVRTTPSTTDEQPQRPVPARRRWKLIVGGVAVAAAAVVGVVVANDPTTVEPLVEQRSAGAIIQAEIDAALAEHRASEGVQLPAYLIIQNQIDAALAEIDASRIAEVERSAGAIIQAEIDAALAEHNAASSD